MFNIDIITLFAIFGTFQSLIFALVFGFKDKGLSNKIFALFLLATSVRIAKNIFVHLGDLNPGLFASHELWRTTVYIGISHQFAVGPLFFLYFLSKLKPDFQWNRKFLGHFLPYAVLLIISPFIRWSFWQNGGLFASYVSILLYYLLSLGAYLKNSGNVDRGTSNWLKALLIITAVLLFTYSPALFHYMGYVGGAALYAATILVAGYLISRGSSGLPFFQSKYDTSSMSKEQAVKIKTRLDEIIQKEKPYLNPELRMKDLADRITVPAHHLSRVINQEFGMNFSDYINTFRIEEAANRLKSAKYRHLKISALSYECGFNSVPTFNTLFKKVYKTTPSQYRKQK